MSPRDILAHRKIHLDAVLDDSAVAVAAAAEAAVAASEADIVRTS